ncbi:MAG: DUF2461 domain-containing protein [Chitinophagales bacterium]|jgi:uncharacterized protein (TIGR02453 family)|nr:DUF2461 domain-containing protein [Bacteroidota bacterium]
MSQIPKKSLQFLKQLAANNNKLWFDAHRNDYDAAKADFINFIADIIKGVSAFDNTITGLEAKKTVFRINRDVRFSKDKSPYKSNLGATLSAGAKNMQTAGYYFQIQPGNKSFAGIGSYMPIPENLAKIRQEIDYNYKEFHKILTSAAFKKHFDGLDEIEVLKTVPKGYTADNQALPYLKHKSFVVTRYFTDVEVQDPAFSKTLINCLKTAYPLVKFINSAIE